ncbi:MAG TPA: amino acid adenylation domain-containing protein, partial [Pyrinomonadaceae bacterium]|nr:amino acid adenylation domain-containing protein [Pyrinomonadaceae bacterium]
MAKDIQHIAELSPTERAALVSRLKQQRAAERESVQTIPRHGTAAHHPLSFAQQRLWFLEQLEPDGPYKVPAAFRLRGPLQVAALEQSVNEIISRHEILRTTFAEIEGRPVQIVAPRLTLSIPVEDLSRLPENERTERVKRTAARLREQPFDFVRGPLVGATLVKLADEEYHFWFLMHHIVSDGWSIGVFLKELSVAYEALAAGRQPELPKLPIQYADFAVWQRAWLQGETLDRQMKYWKERLSGNAPTLELPTDRPRPPVQSYRGASLTHLIDLGLTERLKALARGESVTPYMFLLAVFKTLLGRYTRQDDIVVGTPVANRNRTELEPLIGFFVNTLVLRTDLSGDLTFRGLLSRVRDVTLGAFAHQDVPFEKLVEELQPERDTSRTPLFQVMFSLQNAPLPPLKMGDIEISLLDEETEVSPFDLSFDVIERADGLLCTLEYNTDLFDGATVRRMLKHFAVLLDAAVTDPSASLGALPLLTDEERNQLLFQWNDTRRDFPRDRCVHELFEEQAARTPEAGALVCGGEQLTYAELNARANQLAHHLRTCGVGTESRVGILLERSVEMAVALLAILKAGGGYVAFDPSYPADRLRYMLEDSGVTLLLTQQAAMPNDFGVRPIFLDAERDAIAARDTQNVQSGADPWNIVYLVYTSGSTGRPKGIVIQHRSVVNEVYGFINNHRMTERDRLLQFASLSFDVAAEEFFSAWLSGSCLVMRLDAVMSYADFVSLLQREEITIANLPASFWLEWLTEMNDKGLELPNTLRRVIVGNEKSLEETLAKWQRTVGQKVEWCNAYGPSETTISISNYEPATSSAREGNSIVPIGRPSQNMELYVLDPAEQLVPAGVVGELYIGGVGVARGYHNQPAQTAERFIPHPYSQNAGERLYRSGDLARYRADGNIEFHGRVDEQVKIRGFRIEVGEVEAVLAQHAGVRDSVVVAREDDRGSTRLIAYVVANNGDVQTAELRSFMQQRLPEYMLPSAIVQLAAFPLTPNGKLDRKALPVPDGAGYEADGPYVAPRSELERLIADVWCEALEVERVGVRDNFFNLGGH